MKTYIRYFRTSREAWAFMDWCDKHGIVAGYPSLKPALNGHYTVRFTTQIDTFDQYLDQESA